MIKSALYGIRQAYAMQYPRRNVGMINHYTQEKIDLGGGAWERRPMDDIGICFGVAMVVCDYLTQTFNLTPEIVYVYRRYDAENGDGYEDTLVHAVIYCDGKFYDTDDYSGVENFEDLKYLRDFNDEGGQSHYPFYPARCDRGSRDEIPNKITDQFFASIELMFGVKLTKRCIY